MKQKQPDQKKLELILKTLKAHPQGLWIREIARKTNLDKSLVSRYINEHLKNHVNLSTNLPIKLVKLK
ncbi:MAG: helix-turn-helix domain-containing protein [Nanoarchaeota archaeon]